MVTLQWDAPVGSAVDNYSIAVSPIPLSGAPFSTTVTQTTITLQYNVNYTLQITAVNCIGDGTLTAYMLVLGKVHIECNFFHHTVEMKKVTRLSCLP